MQDLHLVGYTTDRRHLIFSSRRGAKSGGFLVPVDDELVAAIRELAGAAVDGDDALDAPETAPDEVPRAVAPPRVDARLSVREVQARLRAGEDVAKVAADAGVDPGWVERFAPPVRAEQRQMVERALGMRMLRPRGGLSAVPLRRAAAAAMAERGVPFTAESFEAAWTARLVGADRWVVELHFHHRGQLRTAAWAVDTETDALTAVDRTATQIGFVADGDSVPPESETIRSALTITTATSEPAGEPTADPDRSADAERTGRRAAGKRAAAKKAGAKKATGKRVVAKKAGAKKAAGKRAVAKKAARKRSEVRKATAEKAAAKRSAVKKATAKKATAKKATAKKVTGGTARARKAPAKKAGARKAGAPPTTTKKTGTKKTGTKKTGTKKAATRKAPARRSAPSEPATPRAAAREAPPRATVEPDTFPPAASAVETLDDRPRVRLRSPEAESTTAPGGAATAQAPTAPDARIAAQRARAVERSAPTVQFRAGSATPAREAGANGAADPRQVRISSDPMRPTSPLPPSTNGRGDDSARRRRTRQLRAR